MSGLSAGYGLTPPVGLAPDSGLSPGSGTTGDGLGTPATTSNALLLEDASSYLLMEADTSKISMES